MRPREDRDLLPAAGRHALRLLCPRMWVSAVLTLPVLLGSLPEMLGLHFMLPLLSSAVFQAALTAPVVLWGGASFLAGVRPALKNRTADMNTLLRLQPGRPPVSIPVSGAGAAPEYHFETAAVVTTLILVGRWLEAVARGSTSEAIRKLMGLQAKTARVIREGKELELSPAAIVPGDLVLQFGSTPQRALSARRSRGSVSRVLPCWCPQPIIRM